MVHKGTWAVTGIPLGSIHTDVYAPSLHVPVPARLSSALTCTLHVHTKTTQTAQIPSHMCWCHWHIRHLLQLWWDMNRKPFELALSRPISCSLSPSLISLSVCLSLSSLPICLSLSLSLAHLSLSLSLSQCNSQIKQCVNANLIIISESAKISNITNKGAGELKNGALYTSLHSSCSFVSPLWVYTHI